MQNRKLLFTAALLVAFGLVAALVSMTHGPPNASAGASTPTAPPCPTDQVPGPTPGQCVLGTAYPFATVTPTATSCPPDTVLGPTPGGCIHGTPPGFEATTTPCPPGKVFDSYDGSGCGTPTFTPTSQHPYPCSALMSGSPSAAATRGGLNKTPLSIRTPCMVTVTATPCPPDWKPAPTPDHCVHGTFPGPTLTATPCPYPLEPDPNGDGCIKVTITMTPTAIPCPTDMVYDPYIRACVPITPTRTPCPPGKVAAPYPGSVCGTPTATPTSIRPYGADLRLLDHYPSPAIAGRAKTWVFEIENVGSSYGCEAHQVFFHATMTGQADSNYFSPGPILGCHETIEVSVASIVTAHPGDIIAIDAYAQAGASSVMGHVTASDTVIPLGDFNCDGSVNAIDAAFILQLTAALIQPFDCTGAGDVNEDGYTNAIDAFLLLQYHAGLITSFA